MIKKTLRSLLPLAIILFAVRIAVPAVDAIPAITIPVSGTYAFSNQVMTNLGSPVNFNAPFPVKATVSVQVQGVPSGASVGVLFVALNNGCPEGAIKSGKYCYPQDAPCFSSYFISASTLRDNGQSWKVKALGFGGSGQHALSGHIRITFTRLFEAPPLRLISVTNPAAGAVFVRSQAIPIAWTSKGDVGASVKIRFVPLAEPAAAFFIAASTANDGSHSWTPSSGYPGEVWIEVMSLDGKVVGKSGLFTINP